MVVVTVLAGLIWLAWPTGESSVDLPEVEASSLTAAEPQYDFGAISMAKGEVSYSFKITKGGIEPVVIEKIFTSCMCTTAKLMVNGKSFGPFGMPGHGMIPSINQTIPAEGEAEVEVIFDPAAHGPAGVGPIERLVIVETDSGDPLELKISAQVTP